MGSSSPKFWGENINIFALPPPSPGSFPSPPWFERLLGETNILMRLLGWVKLRFIQGWSVWWKPWNWAGWKAAESIGPFQILTLLGRKYFFHHFHSFKTACLGSCVTSYHGILVLVGRGTWRTSSPKYHILMVKQPVIGTWPFSKLVSLAGKRLKGLELIKIRPTITNLTPDKWWQKIDFTSRSFSLVSWCFSES